MGNMNPEEWTRQALMDCAESIWSCNTIEKATSLIHSRHTPICLPNYIAGELKLPSSASTTFINSFEPKTGALLCRLPCAQPDDVEEAIRHARAAFQTWSRTTRAERSRHLRRISELLQEHRELFAVWESIDQGKTVERARVEVDRAISNFSWGPHETASFNILRSNNHPDISRPSSCTSRQRSA
jgi:acyl-CoA reductase-like NAD-dependent aldehyde dehydrogenase